MYSPHRAPAIKCSVHFLVWYVGSVFLSKTFSGARGASNFSLLAGNTPRKGESVSPFAGPGCCGKREKKGPQLWFLANAAALFANMTCYCLLPWLPWVAVCILFSLKSSVHNISTPAAVARSVALAVVWGGWILVVAKVVTLGHIPSQWSAVLPLLFMMKIVVRHDVSRHDKISAILVRTAWDVPLMLYAWLLHSLGAQRFLCDGNGKFITIIDDDMCCSSMPFSSDPFSDEWNEAKISSVVNMQCEYAGPQSAYSTLGIKQLRLPTLDMAEVSSSDLLKGVKFIRAQLKAKPGRRVLVHCKGGRGRAATMLIAWYMAQHADTAACSPDKIADWLKQKRSVVETVVANYPSIGRFRRLWLEGKH